MGKLKAELEDVEAAALVGRRSDERGATTGVTKTAESFNEEAARRVRTNLELRVGELEELLSAARSELDSLYDRARIGSEKIAELSAENTQLRSRLDRAEAEARASDERDAARAGGLVPATPVVTAGQPSTGAYNYSEFAVVSSAGVNNAGEGRRTGPIPPPPPPRLLHNVPQTQVDAETERRLAVAETSLVSERAKSDLLRVQLDSSRKTYDLKIDMSEHRIQFLERQLNEMEQQMRSLYAAFGIMNDDQAEERKRNEITMRTLLESDAAIAMEADGKEAGARVGCGSGSAAKKPPVVRGRPAKSGGFMPRQLSLRTGKSGKGRDSNPKPDRTNVVKAAVRPAAHPPLAKGELFLLLDKKSREPLPAGSVPSKSTRKLSLRGKRGGSGTDPAAAGYIRQVCVLHGANGLYQVRYGDEYDGPVSGVLEFITTGVSSVEHNERSSAVQFGFEVFVNGSDPGGPSLCCAAADEGDFMEWMTAFVGVCDVTVADPDHREGG